MLVQALLVALAYYLVWFLDGALGFQTATRPIVLGTLTGLLCGDITTGVVIGAALEAVYMGISGIGGVTAADYRSATAIATGIAIMSGISMEEGIALAAPVGVICVGLMNLTAAMGNLMEPVYLKLAKEGKVKEYDRVMWLYAIFGQHLVDTLVIFLCCYLGSNVIQSAMDAIPAWIMTGLGASGGMLVVVGLCLIAQAIWSHSTVFFVLLGFVLTKYLSMPIMAVAIVGAFLAYMVFDRNYAIQQVARKAEFASGSSNQEGEDFYG